MKFGLLKTQIEKTLIESYKNETFKNDMFIFNELVLKNKNISKLFYLYDELSTNKGLNESIANEYINQSINIFENTINKINPSELNELKMWVGNVKCENEYKLIDDLFSDNVLELETKIKSKNQIFETLKKEPTKTSEVVNIPMDDMVKIANKTVSDYIESLNESDQKELKTLLSSNDEVLRENYILVKGKVLGKLEKLQENEQDEEVTNRITETIEKVQAESFDKLNYFRLQKLNENL